MTSEHGISGFVRSVARAVGVVLGVVIVITVLSLVVLGIEALIRQGHHQPNPTHVVTVTTTG